MTLIINCIYNDQSWEVSMRVLNVWDNLYDLVVSGRGLSFHIAYGTYAYGAFVCIPSIGIATLTDTFWNQESISRYLPGVDSATLAAAINHLPRL